MGSKMFYIIFLVIICLFATAVIRADEGMFLLKDLHKLGLEAKGLKIPASQVYSTGQPCISEAICQVGGGSGSFVSPEGLILTNHHVAYGAVQRISIPGKDFIREGFLAMNRGEELPARGYEARITLDYIDVTERVMKAAAKARTPIEFTKAIEAVAKKIVAEYEKKEPDIECSVRPMYGGLKYYLFKMFVLKDIRIVYVPPLSIGEFGGETDNWMWPRHTGDFSYLRAYISKNGKPEEFSQENIPYKPRTWLKMPAENLKDGDFVFIMGYPGFTERYQPSHYVDYLQNFTYPWFVKTYSKFIEIMDNFSAKNDEARIKLASLTKGFNNTIKNYQGNLEGFKKINLLDIKKNFESSLTHFSASDPKTGADFADILSSYDKIYKIKAKYAPKELALQKLMRSSRLLEAARRIYKFGLEKVKADLERDEGYQERDIPRMKRALSMTGLQLYIPADIEMFIEGLKEAAALPEDIKIEAISKLFKGKSGEVLGKAIREFAEKAYASSKLGETDFRLGLFGKAASELTATDDPFIKIAAGLEKDFKWQQDFNRDINGQLKKIDPCYIEMIKASGRGGTYPDANGTIRFSYGNVVGYKPRDAVYYAPFTTLSGVIEKDTGGQPFEVPAKLKELHKAKDLGRYASADLNNDVAVAFLSSTDSTGGNSGSPVMNAKGEMVGILFDGNYEALTSDFLFQPELTRSISVDIRYVLFITDKFAGAKHILEEMGIK
jgi:hypothetical protein